MVDFEPYIPHGVPVLMSELLDSKGGLASNHGVISVVARLQMFNAEEQYALLCDPVVDVSPGDATVSTFGVSLSRSSVNCNTLIANTDLLDSDACFIPNRLYIVIGEMCNRDSNEEGVTLEPAENHVSIAALYHATTTHHLVE